MTDKLAHDLISSVLSLTFLGAIVFFVVLSLFLNYHWTRFEIQPAQARKVKRLFFGVSGVLIAVMVVTGLIYIF